MIYICSSCFHSPHMFLCAWWCPPYFIFWLFLLGCWASSRRAAYNPKTQLTYFCVFDCHLLFLFGHAQNHQPTLFDLHNPSSYIFILIPCFPQYFFRVTSWPPKIHFDSYPPPLSSWVSLTPNLSYYAPKSCFSQTIVRHDEGWRCRFSRHNSPRTIQRNYFIKYFQEECLFFGWRLLPSDSSREASSEFYLSYDAISMQ